MAYNFKQEQKQLYMPGKQPSLVDVPAMNYIAVRGHGDPNDPHGDYQNSIPLLYAIAYTIKMSKLSDQKIPGYFDFVVPPLEGFWWQDGIQGVDYQHKEKFSFISAIRLPDFVTPEVFAWAQKLASEKKELDLSGVEFLPMQEGQCVQALHLGSYDDEPITVSRLHQFIAEHQLQVDINDHRHHHEIYLSDPRRTQPTRLKTVIRIPVKPS